MGWRCDAETGVVDDDDGCGCGDDDGCGCGDDDGCDYDCDYDYDDDDDDEDKSADMRSFHTDPSTIIYQRTRCLRHTHTHTHTHTLIHTHSLTHTHTHTPYTLGRSYLVTPVASFTYLQQREDLIHKIGVDVRGI